MSGFSLIFPAIAVFSVHLSEGTSTQWSLSEERKTQKSWAISKEKVNKVDWELRVGQIQGGGLSAIVGELGFFAKKSVMVKEFLPAFDASVATSGLRTNLLFQ